MQKSLPDDVCLAKPFSIYSPIEKAHSGEESGERWLRGPIAPEIEDYDQQTLTKAGIESGLPMYLKLGSADGSFGDVDWGHLYHKSGKNPKYLIAHGYPMKGPDGSPWLADKLLKGKEYAQEAWNHIQAGGRLGHSIQGIQKATDRQDPSRVIKTEIHLVTLDPQPKGFGNYIEPGGPMLQIAKAIMADFGMEAQAAAGWSPMPLHLDRDCFPYFFEDAQLAGTILKASCYLPEVFAIGADLSKSIGRGIPPSDVEMPIGGGGVDMQGAPVGPNMHGHAQRRCPDCNAKNRTSRSTCCRCGALLGSLQKAVGPSLSALIERLLAQGKTEPEAMEIAKNAVRQGYRRRVAGQSVGLGNTAAPRGSHTFIPIDAITGRSLTKGDNGDASSIGMPVGGLHDTDGGDASGAMCPDCGGAMSCASCDGMQKAVTTGDSVVMPGDTGGATLRRQELDGGRVLCKHCGRRNSRRRTRCVECGKPMASRRTRR